MIKIEDIAGKVPDGIAADILGCTTSAVFRYRQKHGLPRKRRIGDKLPDLDTLDQCLKYLDTLYASARQSTRRTIIEDDRISNIFFEVTDGKYLSIWTQGNGILTMNIDRVEDFAAALVDIAAEWGKKRKG